MTRISSLALAGALAFAALPALAQNTPTATGAAPSAVGTTDAAAGHNIPATVDSKTKAKIGAQIGNKDKTAKLPRQTAEHPIPTVQTDTAGK